MLKVDNKIKINKNPTINNNQNTDKIINKSPDLSSDFKTIEKQRFSTFNPLNSDNIRFKKMYWSSMLEKIARIVLIIITFMHLIIAYLIAAKLVNNMEVLKHYFAENGFSKKKNIIYIFIIFTIAFNLFIYIPMAIVRSANALFIWSIIYLAFAILYFLVIQIFYTLLLVLDGWFVENSVSATIPIYMLISALITFIWIVAACLLIVKSDDIRNKLCVE